MPYGQFKPFVNLINEMAAVSFTIQLYSFLLVNGCPRRQRQTFFFYCVIVFLVGGGGYVNEMDGGNLAIQEKVLLTLRNTVRVAPAFNLSAGTRIRHPAATAAADPYKYLVLSEQRKGSRGAPTQRPGYSHSRTRLPPKARLACGSKSLDRPVAASRSTRSESGLDNLEGGGKDSSGSS